MDAGAAASFYRRKGYTVRENVRATGASGNEHRVPLLAEGPLGSLAVFFGGLDGIDGPEMGGARKVARDLGATPVLAADGFSNPDRQAAARLGVVLLDDDAVAVEAPAAAAPPPADPARAWPGLVPVPARRTAAAAEPESHPWPASGRVGGLDGPAARAVDIDDLLAPRRRPEPMLAAAPVPAASAGSAAPEPAAASAVLARAAAQDAEAGDGDSFWSMPRRGPPAPKAPRQAGGGGRPFAWLDGPEPAAAAPASPAAVGGVEYDGVVAARSRPPQLADDGGEEADAALSSPDERVAPSAERLARRARMQRRLAWVLVAAVMLYLFLLWWY